MVESTSAHTSATHDENQMRNTTHEEKLATLDDKSVATSPIGWTQKIFTVLLPTLAIYLISKSSATKSLENAISSKMCYESCSISIVESIPYNVTFINGTIPPSTYYAWMRLIEKTEKELAIAAYKSSLQGKHVLNPSLSDLFAKEGNDVFSSLLEAGRKGRINIKMVENFPPKDKGDNADGVILQNYGFLERRSIEVDKVLGRGKMHSKFLLSDKRHFYLGSANLDWRSLNQKMELGVLVENCPCLGEDLDNIFDVYWDLHNDKRKAAQHVPAMYNMESPLKMQIEGEQSEIYIATSPKDLNTLGRTWDLDAIVKEIDNAKESLDIHVMDYFPLFVYREPKAHFPVIDDALRRAIVRGVRVRILAAALHYPEIGTRFLKSLESLNHLNENVTVEVKIFKVPTVLNNMVISRERRTHNKFMVTESAVVIGTSNWSGDYFVGGTTGAAIVIKQNGERRALVNQMMDIFERDWISAYAHPLEEYYEKCVETKEGDFCESTKDPRMLA